MTQAELLRYIAETLDALGVEYMIGGSHASIYYGEPRLTRDVDVVATLHPGQLSGLLDRFPADEFYVDPGTAGEAVRSRGQFNIIHPTLPESSGCRGPSWTGSICANGSSGWGWRRCGTT